MSSTLLFVVLVQAAIAEDSTPKKEEGGLYGTWQMTEATLAGSRQPAQYCTGKQWTIEKDNVTMVSVVGSSTEKNTRGLQIDASHDPKQLDLIHTDGPLKGKRLQGIYRIDDKFLTICYSTTTGVRPSKFVSNRDDFTQLYVFERVVLKP